MYRVGYQEGVLIAEASKKDILELIQKRDSLWKAYQSPYIITQREDGSRRFDIKRSKPGHAECQQCLADVLFEDIPVHICTEWWNEQS